MYQRAAFHLMLIATAKRNITLPSAPRFWIRLTSLSGPVIFMGMTTLSATVAALFVKLSILGMRRIRF